MERAEISTLKRERLHNLIDIIDEEKINAILVLFDEAVEENWIYSDEFTEELEQIEAEYQQTKIAYSKEDVDAYTQDLLKSLNVK
jgi:predicted AlkP superfamily phosphohydrolase/phosphomutase